MKKDIHPEYVDCTVICSCGETFQTRSTKPELRIELCSKCHPFFTGKQKLVDSGGRVERFQKKYGKMLEEQEAAREAVATAVAEAEGGVPEEAAEAAGAEASAEEAAADEPGSEEQPAEATEEPSEETPGQDENEPDTSSE